MRLAIAPVACPTVTVCLSRRFGKIPFWRHGGAMVLASLLFLGAHSFGAYGCCAKVPHHPNAKAASPSPLQPDYTQQQWNEKTRLHRLIIPLGWRVVPLRATAAKPQLASTLATTLPQRPYAIWNGGYFDPVNGQATAWLLAEDGQLHSPEDNPRLVENPTLAPYWSAIVNRTEFQQWHCPSRHQLFQYWINQPNVAPPGALASGCHLIGRLGAGPQLLPQDTARAEAFYDPPARDPIGYSRPDARTAVGLLPDGRVMLVLVEQTAVGGGLSLPQLATVLQQWGAVQAMNLDGGSSSQGWVEGQTVYAKRNAKGQPVRRAVLSFLAVFPPPAPPPANAP